MKKTIVQMLMLVVLTFFSASLYAQIKVSGTVKEKGGEPLPGVSIVLKGTTNGVITDFDGHYSFEVPDPKSVLVFSFVGMETQEVPVNGRPVIDVFLASSTIGVDEVVVTALGITKEKKSLAFSVGEVNSDDLVQAGNTSVMKSLDGKVSGVNFTSLSSDPTSSVLVNIRGTTTMPTKSDRDVSKSGQPLYVIDGVPVGQQTFTTMDGVDFGNILSQLNPEDIESITILKGGSAGALYGAEGGNGVVMITTKSGKGGRKGIGVSVNSSFTVEQPYQFIEMQDEFGQGERAYEWEYDNTDTWGPKLDGSYTAKFWNVKTQSWDEAAQYSYHENRVKAYLQNGHTINNDISVSGNYEQGSFRLSFSDMDNTGVMPNTKTYQKGVSLNSSYKVTNDIKVSVSANYIITDSPNKANSTGSNSALNDLLFSFPANLQPLNDMKNYWLNGFEGITQNGAMMKDPGDGNETTTTSLNNPWWSAYENIHRFTRYNTFGKIQLDWAFSKQWSALFRTGLESVTENYEHRKSWGDRKDLYGEFSTSQNVSSTYNTDLILTYANSFGKLDLSVSGGANYNYGKTSYSSIDAGDLAVAALFTVANAASGTLTSDYTWSTSQTYSAYGTASLSYGNKYFLDITGRNDWKGILEEEKIHYFYPSVSASWIISQTFSLPDAIDLLKLRLGWADVGNGLTKERNVDTYTFESSDWGDVKTADISTTLVDPDIKAMHSITKEGGIDLWVLKKRIMFDFTYYIKDQLDQIGDIPTVQGTGYTGMTTNIGDVEGKGFEWGLTVTPIRNANWNWDISASFTHYKAKIKKLSDSFATDGYVFADYDGKTKVKIAKGEEIGNIYEQNPILKVKTGKYAGQYLLSSDEGKFQESSDERDRKMLGNFNPDYIIGFNTSLKFKRVTLNLVGSLRVGGKYVSVNQQYLESNGKAKSTLGAGKNNPVWVGGRDADHGGLAWPSAGSSDYGVINDFNNARRSDFHDASYVQGVFVKPDYTGDSPGDDDYIVNGADPNNTFYDFPYNAYGDAIWNFASTRTFDATNFKMKEVSLVYSLPNSLTNKLMMHDVVISLIGRNVFQWNKSGRHEDPESAFSGVGTNQGILRATLPSIRSLGFKLGLNF